MSAEVAQSRVARRVVRGVTDEFRKVVIPRKELSYRGGWQNSTQKLQWFWNYFRKYGFLANFANMLRMREAWWETGEKRLVGMDALGHKYWETDDPGRTYAWNYRFIDFPHHFHFADQSKVPRKWVYWMKMGVGRSPPQMEALHKELGPEWREYNYQLNTSYEAMDEADTHRNPQGVDGFGGGMGTHIHPMAPDFKAARDYYGFMFSRLNMQTCRTGFFAKTHQDEFNPKGGAMTKLAAEGHDADGYNQQRMNIHNDDKMQRFKQPTFSNPQMNFGKFDKGEQALKIWWEYRQEHADKSKESRAAVSAFDNPLYSSKNTAGTTYGFINRYKEIDPQTDRGYQKSKLNPKNVRRSSFMADDQHMQEAGYNRALKDSYQARN